jgi:hypothetical protein
MPSVFRIGELPEGLVDQFERRFLVGNPKETDPTRRG